MQRGIAAVLSTFIFTFLTLASYTAKADAYVYVTEYGFSPSTVNISEGDAVFWICSDYWGPYTITSDDHLWQTGYVFDYGDYFGLRFPYSGTYGYHDAMNGNSGTVHVGPNIPPSVTITNPLDTAVFTAPASFTFGVDAWDADGDGMSDVEFYLGTNMLDDVFYEPFTTEITNLPAGNYTLTAIAYDNGGAAATNSVAIVVLPPTPITLQATPIRAGQFQFTASGLTAGKTNILQYTTNLASTNWIWAATNVSTDTSQSFTNLVATGSCFFRVIQLP